MYTRYLNFSDNYNILLFGARGTGKTTLLGNKYSEKETYRIDLLDLRTEKRLQKNPDLLEEIIDALPREIKYIVIDEVQKIPELLDTVHRLIHKYNGKRFFTLTGSSARKLKKGSANLLAGRAFVKVLFPLTYAELGNDFDLISYLKYGGLPAIYKFTSDDDKIDYLETYAMVYLKEEIWSEHLIRELNPFRSFLEVAASTNGRIVNFTKIAEQVGSSTKTIQQYYDILVDTYIGIYLESYHTSVRKRCIVSPKFYFIDTGIKRALDNTLPLDILPRTYAFGDAFEHFFITQIYAWNHYYSKRCRLFYLTTKDGAEINLIIEKPDKSLFLIEIKSTDDTSHLNLTSFEKLANDVAVGGTAEIFCISCDKIKRKAGAILFIHWRDFLEYITPEKQKSLKIIPRRSYF